MTSRNRLVVLQVDSYQSEDRIDMAIRHWNERNPGEPIAFVKIASSPVSEVETPTVYHSDGCRYVGERTQLGIRPLDCTCEGTTDPR